MRSLLPIILILLLGHQPVHAAVAGEPDEPPAETDQPAAPQLPDDGMDQLPPGPIGARPAEEAAAETDGPRISPRVIAIGVGVAALLAAMGGGGGGGSATQH